MQLFVIFIQAIFNAWQDWSTSRTMSSIKNMLPTETLVLREGQKTKIAASELVKGDIVYLTLGSKLPADLRLIEVSSDLAFDRATLTGESDAIRATVDCTDDNLLESKNICLMGTYTVMGSGVGVVIQTGDNTVFGRITKLSLSERTGLTTLQNEILRFIASENIALLSISLSQPSRPIYCSCRFVTIIGSAAIVTGIIVIVVWGAWLHPSYPNYLSVSAIMVNVICEFFCFFVFVFICFVFVFIFYFLFVLFLFLFFIFYFLFVLFYFCKKIVRLKRMLDLFSRNRRIYPRGSSCGNHLGAHYRCQCNEKEEDSLQVPYHCGDTGQC